MSGLGVPIKENAIPTTDPIGPNTAEIFPRALATFAIFPEASANF